VKIVKYLHYLEFLAKLYSNIAGNVVRNYLRQNYVISSLCAVTLYAYSYGLPRNKTRTKRSVRVKIELVTYLC